jgi:hypothetical protein
VKKITYILVIVSIVFYLPDSFAQPNSNTYKPWTYWWWMGNAVNKTEIKKQLDEFSGAGIGGVHIIPVYGVKGYENQFIQFLSKDWLEMVEYTIEQAGELNLGVDITLGTGWPYGGSWVDNLNAAKRLIVKEYQLKQTDHININTDSIIKNNGFLDLFAIIATNNKEEQLNLSSQITDKTICRDVKLADWKLTCFGNINTNQLVKRAAPGGEGLVIDYFDRKAVMTYLSHFDSIFSGSAHSFTPRAYYHDSYEVYHANWTIRFTDRFRELRGYDLKEFLPILLDTLDPGRPHIIHDIRETLSELLYSEFAMTWTEWCKKHGIITRYQAHGSPSNLLDLYALSDFPETESFGCSNFSIPKLHCDPDYEEERFGRPSPLMMKFASSPANLLNKPLVCSETGTWLANHFKVSLSQIKPQIDELFVSGINHVFYHGITYSPQNEEYPGWLFYASTNFGQTSHFWDELPLLNSYITECQRILQNTTPDNDILLYFPINDLWTKYPGDILLPLDVHTYSNWFSKTNFGETAQLLWDNGFTFDYISDKQIKQLIISPDGNLSIYNRSSYSLIVIPSIDYISKSTLKILDSLAQNGAKILFINKFPQHFPGFMAHKISDEELPDLKKNFFANKNTIISDNLEEGLKLLGIYKEEIKSKGLDFIRKRTGSGSLYFITNLSNQFYEDSICLSVKSDFIEIFDPQSLKRGYIETSDKFFLQLPPGKSCFIKTLQEKPESELWHYSINRDTIYLNKKWTVSFISENNQNLKTKYKIDTLRSWTEWGDDNLNSFCGKAKYVSSFSVKNYDKSKSYRLVFDDINETAKVSINDISCGTIWALPYNLEIPANVLKQNNTIEITVQNLSANLIKQIDNFFRNWKKFYDINFVDIQYKPFDASDWDYVPSGLSGNVILIKNK